MPDESTSPLTPEFVQRLTASQSALYAFIISLMGGVDQANDVLQETNLKLCRRAAEYDPEQPFLRWGYVFARYEVMAWRKRQQRSRLVLDDDLVAQVAAEIEGMAHTAEEQLAALEKCVEKLPARHRALLKARYQLAEPVGVIARRLARPENAVAALLYRLRKTLAECMAAVLPKEGAA